LLKKRHPEYFLADSNSSWRDVKSAILIGSSVERLAMPTILPSPSGPQFGFLLPLGSHINQGHRHHRQNVDDAANIAPLEDQISGERHV